MQAHFRYCMDYLRKHDYGRYLSCLYLEENTRLAAFAIYAFDFEIRQIPNRISEPQPGEIRLQWWRDTLLSGLSDQQNSGNPIARAMQETIAEYSLPLAKIERLLDAHVFDLYHDPMTDCTAFEAYLGETSSVLYYLLTLTLEGKKQGREYANACGHGGVFYGIVDLLKALPSHAHQQKSYFPDELSQHSRVISNGNNEVKSTVNTDMLNDIVTYATHHHNLASEAIASLPAQSRKLFNGLCLSKLELQQIAKTGINLNTRYQPLSPLRMNWCLWRGSWTG